MATSVEECAQVLGWRRLHLLRMKYRSCGHDTAGDEINSGRMPAEAMAEGELAAAHMRVGLEVGVGEDFEAFVWGRLLQVHRTEITDALCEGRRLRIARGKRPTLRIPDRPNHRTSLAERLHRKVRHMMGSIRQGGPLLGAGRRTRRTGPSVRTPRERAHAFATDNKTQKFCFPAHQLAFRALDQNLVIT